MLYTCRTLFTNVLLSNDVLLHKFGKRVEPSGQVRYEPMDVKGTAFKHSKFLNVL